MNLVVQLAIFLLGYRLTYVFLSCTGLICFFTLSHTLRFQMPRSRSTSRSSRRSARRSARRTARRTTRRTTRRTARRSTTPSHRRRMRHQQKRRGGALSTPSTPSTSTHACKLPSMAACSSSEQCGQFSPNMMQRDIGGAQQPCWGPNGL